MFFIPGPPLSFIYSIIAYFSLDNHILCEYIIICRNISFPARKKERVSNEKNTYPFDRADHGAGSVCLPSARLDRRRLRQPQDLLRLRRNRGRSTGSHLGRRQLLCSQNLLQLRKNRGRSFGSQLAGRYLYHTQNLFCLWRNRGKSPGSYLERCYLYYSQNLICLW